MNWRRFDTLFLRLFVLMWVTLVASNLMAFTVVNALVDRPPGPERFGPPAMPLPALPSLPMQPPGDAFDPAGGQGPDAPAPRAGMLPLDYAVRALVIALGAALGARWLARPMRRLSQAAGGLSSGLAQGRPVPQIDEQRGTHEVREAARVFNAMAVRLQQRFDARSLQLAALSHDLRTPMTRLRLRLERLGEGPAQAATADLHEMDAMIDDTLALMREQRDAEPARVVDAASLLQALVDDHAEQGDAVSLDAPLPALRLRAHPVALRRIVDNLVGNALRYGLRARVGMTTRGPEVEIHVDDDGPGLPPERIARAFEPWVRLADGEKRLDHGHGIGLAIARELAERDGGSLTLINRPQGGLRALLVLPAA